MSVNLLLVAVALQGLGEDLLNHSSGSSTGVYKGAYAWQNIKRGSTVVRSSAYLPQSGCASVSAEAGTYTVKFQPAMRRGTSTIWVYANDTSSLTWFTWTGTLPGRSSGTQTININSAQFGITNVAAVGALILDQKSEAVASNTIYRAYANQSCLSSDPNSSCAGSGKLWLGSGDNARKFVIGHEMGHLMQDGLWGETDFNYNASRTPSVNLCTCSFVSDPGARSHCIQSLEFSSASQVEGFGHFFAADLYNNPGDSNAFFTYYKEFALSATNVLSPPLWISIYNTWNWRWMDNTCPTSNGGVELDWLTFYYELNNKTSNAFSYANLSAVYKRACGNALCDGDDIAWDDVVAATQSVYGSTSSKTTYLTTQMQEHGVDTSFN